MSKIWHEAFEEPHKSCTYNRAHISKSNKCGCFYCHEIFDAGLVVDFTYGKDGRDGTAICPRCGMDCVMPDSSGFPVEKAFIEIQGGFWFNKVGAEAPTQRYWLGQLKKAGYYSGEI